MQSTDADQGRADWPRVVTVFWITSMVEGLGVSQVFALLPQQLFTMGVTGSDRLAFVGLFGSLLFVVGMPLVPLWGVWADLYSRKAVIARSALVEAVVFACVALSREPWQLALSLLLIGFQLGNTGVMLGAIRDVVPRQRVGTLIALFGVSGPIGFAVGPALGALLVDGLGWSLSGMFWVSAGLSVATAAAVWFGADEVRPAVVPSGRVLVAGPAALVGAAVSPLGGIVGDRIGFRPVLLTALVVGGIALLAVPLAPTILALALAVVAFTAANGLVGAMVFSLLATEVPVERRSQTLNLVYLPLYAAGVVGPAVGGALAGPFGAAAPFWAGAAVFLAGAVIIALRVRGRPAAATAGA